MGGSRDQEIETILANTLYPINNTKIIYQLRIKIFGRLRQENGVNPGGGACSELTQKKKKKEEE